LEGTGLIVRSAFHGSAVDGVYDSIRREEPHLVPPFFWLFGLWVGGIVVVDQVRVSDALVERWVERSVGEERGQEERHCWRRDDVEIRSIGGSGYTTLGREWLWICGNGVFYICSEMFH
jgi:hypothetical protein